MDDIVKQAMIKWPNVPNCYGWLGLDARGNWYMRDDRSQSLGSFASGQWYFQNGPQRVYVELEVTPWIWRVGANFSVTAHDGRAVAWKHSWMDENGWLYCETSLGFGLVHTQDVAVAAEAIEQGIWSVQDTLRSTLPMRWAYLESPQSLQATKKPDQ
jgi:hypothetical protein